MKKESQKRRPRRGFPLFPLGIVLGILGGLGVLAGCRPREIRIGFIGGLSGYYADLSIAGRNGLRLALEEANKNREMGGSSFHLIAQDDKQDPEEARRAYKKLVEDRVVAIVGPMTSSMAMAILPDANKEGIPLISPTVSTPDLSGQDDVFIRVVAPSTQEARALASLAVEEGYRRVLVVFDASNEAFSATIMRNFIMFYEREWQKKNEKVSGTSLRYNPAEKQGGQSFLEQIRQYQPDALLLVATSIDTALLAQHIRKAGFSVPLLGTGWGMSQALVENGGAAVEGMRFCVPFNPLSTNPEWLTFKERYLETYGVPPDFAASQGYLAGRILVEALKRGGPRHIKENILKIKEFQGPQGKISFDPYGDPVTELHVLEVRNGQFVTSGG